MNSPLITLTNIETFLKNYPSVFLLYRQNRDELLSIRDTGSNEFQIHAELNFVFWRMAEYYIKLEANDE